MSSDEPERLIGSPSQEDIDSPELVADAPALDAARGWETSAAGEAPDEGTDRRTGEEAPDDKPPADARQAPRGGARGRARLRRAVIATAMVSGVLGLLYGLDLLVNAGEIPRGVSVAGVDIAGLSPSAAREKLKTRLEPRLAEPATVRAGSERATIPAESAEVAVDWVATVDRAAQRPLAPWTRLASLFVGNPVKPVVSGDTDAIRSELGAIGERVDREPVEGSVRFDGARPVPVFPEAGRHVPMDRAVQDVLRGWARGEPISLPVAELPVRASERGVRTALETVAKPAVSGPVTLRAGDRAVSLAPEAIGSALRFEPGRGGELTATIEPGSLRRAAGQQLAGTEKASKNARFTFPGGTPRLHPAVSGRAVDWQRAARELLPALTRTNNRVLEVPYRRVPAKLTTAEAERLGIKEVIGEFTTTGFAQDSGVNIRRVAEEVNGAVVRPGATFSLNGHTGKRGVEQGYVPAGVIKQGEPARAVGGGISQFATTLYNAAYFAAMEDVEHKEHSYYISRYPMAREATVFQNPDGSSVIDLKFRNNEPTGVVIQAVWTPSSITVKLWGTEQYRVESVTGEPHSYTGAPTITKQPGEPCTPSSGSSGFSASDTRIVRDLDGNEISRNTRTVRYRGQPRVVCLSEQPDDAPDSGQGTGGASAERPPGATGDAGRADGPVGTAR